MTVISVPEIEEEEWPTLGPQVCSAIEANLVFGPGDLEHQPARLDVEKRALIYKAYEVHPQFLETRLDGGRTVSQAKNPVGGRRRFRVVTLVLQKGSAKTEFAVWIASEELDPEGPVRCDGFDAFGRPVGRSVPSPYIPLFAFAAEQVEDLAFGVMCDILQHSPIASRFDIGLERICRAENARAKAVPLAGAPNSRDGALTTFQHKDETHRMDSQRHRDSHRTTQANLTKRYIAEPWELQTTTAWVPGTNSVAEQTAKYAEQVGEGKIKDSRLFYFHRQASDGYDLKDRMQLRHAVVEAAGAMASWKDIEGICDLWQDPEADFEYLERVYLNRPIATASQAFNASIWATMAAPQCPMPREKITLGFDGSIKDDSTALIATHLASGYQWVVGLWEKPQSSHADWEVPRTEVNDVVAEAFNSYEVVMLYGDPSKFETWMAEWAGRYGAKRVVAWPTTLYRKMATALKAYANAINAGEVLHDGDARFAHHIGNAQKKQQNFLDDDGTPLWLIQKDRPGSPNKIDAAMAGCLSWRAALDAIALGALTADHGLQIFFGSEGE